MKYSIHRGLSELKTLDSRINKAIQNGIFIDYIKKSNGTTYNNRLSVEDFKTKAKSSLESINSLIERRDLIKRAIVNSNAVTEIEIGGVTMTVAAAIERKESIKYEKALLKAMKDAYNSAMYSLKNRNDIVEENINDMIERMVGGDKSAKDSIAAIELATTYREKNGWELVDPLKLKDIIDDMEKNILEFEGEVDYKLSTSNAITEIEIPD